MFCLSQTAGSLLRRVSGPISLEYGALAAGPAGGGPAAGADDADAAFTIAGVFAFTFAADLSNVGYAASAAAFAAAFAAADAAASAGFGVGDFVGFGDFSGFGDFPVLGIFGGFALAARLRLAASNCKSLGGGGFSLGGGGGLVSRPGVLDLAFTRDSGSGAGRRALALLPPLRLVAASMVSFGRKSMGVCFVGIGCCVISTFSAPGEADFPSIRFLPADMERKKPPRYVAVCAACIVCFSGGGAGPYVFAEFALPLPASCANLVTKSGLAPISAATFLRIPSSLMAACLACSSKTLSVSAFASATASSTPEPRCADSAFAAAGADDEDAAVDAAVAGGPYDCAGPFGDGPRCVSGSVRAGRGVRVRFGPKGAGSGTAGGFTNVCPKCGPG